MSRKKKSTPDLDVSGSNGFYTITATTQDGVDWMNENVHLESWQMAGLNAISLDDTSLTADIAEGAFDDGLSVVVNDRRYIGNGRVAA